MLVMSHCQCSEEWESVVSTHSEFCVSLQRLPIRKSPNPIRHCSLPSWKLSPWLRNWTLTPWWRPWTSTQHTGGQNHVDRWAHTKHSTGRLSLHSIELLCAGWWVSGSWSLSEGHPLSCSCINDAQPADGEILSCLHLQHLSVLQTSCRAETSTHLQSVLTADSFYHRVLPLIPAGRSIFRFPSFKSTFEI